MKILSLLTLMTFFAFTLVLNAQAADEEPVTEEVQQTVDPLIEEQKKAIDDTNMSLAKIMSTLKDEERKHFTFAYSNYNLIRTTQVVQRDVGSAIQKCGENNPEMKTSLDERFKVWDKVVGDVLKDAEANLENTIMSQDYVSEKDARAVFKKVDIAREKTDARFKKIPVTSPEACEFLLAQMDETQDRFATLLAQTLLSFSQASPKIDTASEEGAAEADPESKE